MGDGILVSLHLINMASPLPLPPQLRGFQIVNNNRFQDKSASRLCRGGGGGGGGGLGVFGNGQNGFLPLSLRRLLSRGEAAAAMEQGKQQQLEGGGFSDRKEARRAAKERKKQEEATRREQEWQAKLATHSEQQMDAIRRRIVEVSHMRREARKARKLKLEQAMKMGAPDVVIDLEFSHLMTTSQLSSLMQQVKFCYGANGKAATPCRLSVTSCRGIVADELDKIQGSQQWFINKEERCWLQVFERRKTDLVYLTADSPNLLTAVDPAGVYIVGGIVDRNQWKGATLMKAMNLSISHAKLPIGEHLKLTTSETVLAAAPQIKEHPTRGSFLCIKKPGINKGKSALVLYEHGDAWCCTGKTQVYNIHNSNRKRMMGCPLCGVIEKEPYGAG